VPRALAPMASAPSSFLWTVEGTDPPGRGARWGLVKNGAGDLFGIITTPDGIVAVNDGTNVLELFRG
jgi:hypothetical protein